MTAPHRIVNGLASTPLVTLTCVAALGLALGATTLVYSVVDGVLLRTLPFRDPDRLVVVWETKAEGGRFENVASPVNFLYWKDAVRSMTGLASVTMTFRGTFGLPGPPEEVPMQMVSGRLFELVGVDAAAGRTFTPTRTRQATTSRSSAIGCGSDASAATRAWSAVACRSAANRARSSA